MKFTRFVKPAFKDQSGAVAVIVALSMVMLLGFAALAIDVGYLAATKNELQNVADAAALAATGELGDIYANPAVDPATYVCDRARIVSVAQAVVGTGKNRAGAKDITIGDADIFINNIAGAGTTVFSTNNLNQPDAIRVIARRDSVLNSSITTFFARIFNISSLPVTADATAALTGESTAGPGGLPLPVAINKSWVDAERCNENLTFHPSSANTCSAWHAYDNTIYPGDTKDYDSNANDMRNMIDATTDDTYNSPNTVAGVTEYEFTNGTLASLFTHNNIQLLFDAMKVKNDFEDDHDNDSSTWTTTIPVFDDTVEGCSPNGLIVIDGFTSITITDVTPPPETTIYATVTCGVMKPGRGGGSNYGTMGTIPGLVE